MEKVNGTCHCGKVSWVASLPILTVVQCHCQNCRKLQGSDYSSWVVITEDKFEITSGKSLLSLYQFSKRSQKSFCSLCGTIVFGINGKHFPKHKLFSLGCVANYCERLKPQLQVYTEFRAPWCLE